MKEREIEEKQLKLALKHLRKAVDYLGMPAWFLGSEEEPDLLLGIFLGSRELLTSLIQDIEDVKIVKFIPGEQTADKDEELH